jgi:Na+-translocating ferredoxin:NAD+ oxidoreductase RnfC subunit
MRTVRTTRAEHFSVAHCPICNGEHVYDFQAVIDEVVGVMHMMMMKVETKSCAVTCPEKIPLIDYS